MAQPPPDLSIVSLSGGFNDEDASHSLPDDQCVVAENVEFFTSTMGERRRGTSAVVLGTAAIANEAAIVHLTAHRPVLTAVADTELWAIGATVGTTVSFGRRSAGVWTDITPTDAPTTTAAYIYRIRAQSGLNKLYYAYKSGVDRLHVWDGTTLRRVGLAAPTVAPTAANTAIAGALITGRTYRVRFTVQTSGITTLRSEPSPELAFTPDGAHNGIIVTRPAVVDGIETHWELEALSDDGNFYILATIAIATTIYTDTTAALIDYADGDLSEDIGEYELIPSVEFIRVDQDRLVFAGNHEDTARVGEVGWSPVRNDPGVGNDERLPTDTNNTLDIGGVITDMSDALNGAFYIFEFIGIHKMQRTGSPDKAYESFLLYPTRGAIKGSVVSGVDQYGRGCVFFLDPAIGPSLIGGSGVQRIAGLRTTWKRVNTAAAHISARAVYYPDKQQVIWWVASDDADTPNLVIRLQVDSMRQAQGGALERGWSTADGVFASALTAVILPENATDEDAGVGSITFRPYIGITGPAIHRCDTGNDDAGTSYRARIKTKPLLPTGLLSQWGAMNGAVLAEPLSDANVKMDVTLIPDFGNGPSKRVIIDFLPDTDEDQIIKYMDNLTLADSEAIEIEFADHVTVHGGRWALQRFDASRRLEGSN